MLEQGVGGPPVGAQGPSLWISLHKRTGQGQERGRRRVGGAPTSAETPEPGRQVVTLCDGGAQTPDAASPRGGAGMPDRRLRKAGPGRWAGQPRRPGTGGSEALGPWADTGLQAKCEALSSSPQG